ncbi:hypothetical protein BST29_06505 [Mycobacterium malmoense]|uniref:Uncharacterized protein n=1 Tax=Mycobacterium malmoense TaxID=1780 RepID=A0ABX3SWS0_MYCMA|nr:hypothetical protein BST29_06505 [Mycobacterium malmoense]
MGLRGAGRSRRWRAAIAIAAASSLFIALIAGSPLRPKYSAATLPEPVAWSHRATDATTDAIAHAGQVQLHANSTCTSHGARGSSWGSAPTNKKPFKSMWMTHDRPPTWTRISPQSLGSPLPISFTTSEFHPGGPQAVAPPAAPVDQDILTQLCVARR